MNGESVELLAGSRESVSLRVVLPSCEVASLRNLSAALGIPTGYTGASRSGSITGLLRHLAGASVEPALSERDNEVALVLRVPGISTEAQESNISEEETAPMVVETSRNGHGIGEEYKMPETRISSYFDGWEIPEAGGLGNRGLSPESLEFRMHQSGFSVSAKIRDILGEYCVFRWLPARKQFAIIRSTREGVDSRKVSVTPTRQGEGSRQSGQISYSSFVKQLRVRKEAMRVTRTAMHIPQENAIVVDYSDW